MTYRAVIIAGWLAMASAFLSIPASYFSYLLGKNSDISSLSALIGIQTGGALLYVAINLYLKKLLNALFKFHDTDRCIDLMIAANVVVFVISAAAPFTRFKEGLDFAAFGIIILQEMVQIRFGYRLLKLPYNLDGMLKPFCFLNMATGLCFASSLAAIVFFCAGIVVGAITDLMLGTIFFHIAHMAREAHAHASSKG